MINGSMFIVASFIITVTGGTTLILALLNGQSKDVITPSVFYTLIGVILLIIGNRIIIHNMTIDVDFPLPTEQEILEEFKDNKVVELTKEDQELKIEITKEIHQLKNNDYKETQEKLYNHPYVNVDNNKKKAIIIEKYKYYWRSIENIDNFVSNQLSKWYE